MSTFKELPNTLKPREKALIQGINCLSDIELLAIILKTGSKGQNVLELSSQLFYKYKSLSNIINLSINELSTNLGINKIKALEIITIKEILVRISKQSQIKSNQVIKLESAKDVYNYISLSYDNVLQEKMMVFYLNSKNAVLFEQIISIGDDSKTINNNKLICKKAIELMAKKVIVTHNHLSNDASPSVEDIASFISLKNALSNVSIKLVDHLIICANEYYSLFYKTSYSIEKQIFD